MAGEPNELPEGGEGGSGGGGRWWPGLRPHPAELPVELTIRAGSVLLREILGLRSRLHQFENQQLIAAFMGRRGGGIGGPAELPEGGEGGGGGVIPGVFPG